MKVIAQWHRERAPVVTESESPASVAIVHDYVTQMGGAERLVLLMCKAFPGAPLYTSVYEPSLTFPEFAAIDIRPMAPLNSLATIRRHHRIGFPFYGPAFRHLMVDADVTLCSSTGWAHLVSTTGKKVVFCNTPARWIYQREEYVRQASFAARFSSRVLTSSLRKHDIRAAKTADVYIANSSEVRRRVAEIYGLNSHVITAPSPLSIGGPRTPLPIEPGFLLVVSRLLPYKNVDLVITAADRLHKKLVVVGDGPDRDRLERLANPAWCTFAGRVSDASLRWLYANCTGVVAMSYEDYGLVPIEANAFGRPVIALHWGGFLDTVIDGVTGIFCERVDLALLLTAIQAMEGRVWDVELLEKHAASFEEDQFISQLRTIVFGSGHGRP